MPETPPEPVAGIPADPAAPRVLRPAPTDAGERVDRFVANAIEGMSRSRVKALIEQGHLTRDGARVTEPAEAVRPGVAYTLTPPPTVAARPEGQAMDLHILYEDADLVVLDKPPGLVVHPAPGHEEGTLVNALLAHCGDSLTGIGGERRPGIVHRLDKDTSGVMVVAKTQQALASLSATFAARDLDRAYLALAWGLTPGDLGAIEGAIGRDPRDRKRMAVVARGGKPALTRIRRLGQHAGAVSLLECTLATGRTHQIRVHLSQSGHPIVGDPVYLRRIPGAARLLTPALRGRLLDFPRQSLHAGRLGFAHPRTGEWLAFTTPPPADMMELLDALGFGALSLGPHSGEHGPHTGPD